MVLPAVDGAAVCFSSDSLDRNGTGTFAHVPGSRSQEARGPNQVRTRRRGHRKNEQPNPTELILGSHGVGNCSMVALRVEEPICMTVRPCPSLYMPTNRGSRDWCGGFAEVTLRAVRHKKALYPNEHLVTAEPGCPPPSACNARPCEASPQTQIRPRAGFRSSHGNSSVYMWCIE